MSSSDSSDNDASAQSAMNASGESDEALQSAASSSSSNNGNPETTTEQQFELSDSDEEEAASNKSASSSDAESSSEKKQKLELSDSDDDKEAVPSKTGKNFNAKERLRQKLLLSDSDDAASNKSNEEAAANDDVVQNLILSDSEEEAAPEPEIIVDEIPSNRLKLGDLGPVFVRLPNFLSIEATPFDPRTYEAEVDEDDVKDTEGRARIKLKIENTIRWRNIRCPETGEIKKQSNAKIVKCMSLHLGNEIFEIQDQPSMPNLHLFTRQGASLQAQVAFKRKFTFRPHSTDTLTHRKMTMNMADKSNRIQKVKMVTDVGINPEKARSENIKKEDEKLRAMARKQAAQRRVRERSREGGLSSGFLEGFDSDNGENVGALKRSYGDAAHGRNSYNPYGGAYYSDESEENESQSQKVGRARVIDSSEDEESQQANESRLSGQNTSEQRTKTRIIEDD